MLLKGVGEGGCKVPVHFSSTHTLTPTPPESVTVKFSETSVFKDVFDCVGSEFVEILLLAIVI
jgi:hypothetical protein